MDVSPRSYTLHDGLVSDEASIGATLLADGPHEGSLHRRDRGVQIRSVETQPGLQTKRVTRSQSAGHHLLVLQDLLHQRDRVCSGDLHLVAILASVAAASHATVHTAHLHVLARHERHLRHVHLGEATEHCRSHRSLDRDQTDVAQVLHLHVLALRLELRHLLLEVLHVAVLARAVHHLVTSPHTHHTPLLVVARIRYHRVVDDASVLLAQQSQSSLSRLKRVNVAHQNSLQKLHAVLSSPSTTQSSSEALLNLTHVRNIEQTTSILSSHSKMLLKVSKEKRMHRKDSRILHRQGITSKLNHFSLQFVVEIE